MPPDTSLDLAKAEIDALIAASVDIVFVIDDEGRYLKVGGGGQRGLYRPPHELLGKRFVEVLPRAQAEEFLAIVRRAIAEKRVQLHEYSLEVGGEELWFSSSIAPASKHTVVWVARDVSAQRAAEGALTASEAAHRDLLASLPAIIYWVSPYPPYQPTYISPGIEALGYTLEEWFAEPDMWLRIIHEDDRDRVVAETEAAIGAMKTLEYEYRVIDKSGQTRWIHDRGEFLRDSRGQPLAWRGVMLDVTERRALQERLAALTEEDELTGLLNRRGLRRLAEQTIKLEHRTGRRSALLYLDLDDFKTVNDKSGHAAGDACLRITADVLRAAVREGDIVARIGGDEFVVFAAGIAASGDGERLADRIRHDLAASDVSSLGVSKLSATIGVSEYERGSTLEELLDAADQVLRARKVTLRVRAPTSEQL